MTFRYDKDKEEFIITEATKIEYNQISLWLTRFVQGYKYTPQYKMGIWNGKESYFRDGKINLGLWHELQLACNTLDVPFKIENKEDVPLNRDITQEQVIDFCKEYFDKHQIYDKKNKTWSDFMPYSHQVVLAYKIMKARYCLAECATSGGKTLIISIIIFYTLKHINPDAKFLIIVPSITLVTQFSENIREYCYGQQNLDKLDTIDKTPFCDIRIEEIMSDKPQKSENPNIYIGTYQSLGEYDRDFFKQFHTVITDEAHKSKASTIKKILKRTFRYAYCRFGVSGTFPADDSYEILTVESVLGPKIATVTANELKNKGIITPVQIKALILNHNDSAFQDKLKSIRNATDGKDVYDLEKQYIHASKKRTEYIKKIVSHCDNNTLLLFHTIEYGLSLYQELVKSFPDKLFYYIDGEVCGKDREAIKAEMEKTGDGKNRILVATFGTLSTGVSINALFNVIFADSFKSEQVIIQSIGRILRLHADKDIANVYDLVDVFSPVNMSNILFRQYIERTKFYRKRQYPYKEYKINL